MYQAGSDSYLRSAIALETGFLPIKASRAIALIKNPVSCRRKSPSSDRFRNRVSYKQGWLNPDWLSETRFLIGANK